MIPMLEINPKISEVTKSEMSKIKMHSTKVNIHSEYLLYICQIYLLSAVVCFPCFVIHRFLQKSLRKACRRAD